MLPRYSGTFEVGIIDLELPVRTPRSFAAKGTRVSVINAKRAERKKAAAAAKGQSEEERTQEWDPFRVKAKTCTLHLSTVLFSIYYPSSITKKEAKSFDKAAWLGRPKHRALQGLVSYLGQYGTPLAVPASPALFYLAAAKMKARCAPPLASPDDPRTRAPPPFSRHQTGLFGDEPARFPVVVFSHGLAGSRLSYSQFCGELASYGIIVAALEHRDGSGVRSTVRVPDTPPPGKAAFFDGVTPDGIAGRRSPAPPSKSSTKPRVTEQSAKYDEAQTENSSSGSRTRRRKADVPYLVYETLGLRPFATDPTEEEVGLRQAQLAMRAAELKECLYVLQRIERGEGDQVAAESTRGLANKLSSGVAKRQRRKQRRTEPRTDKASLEGAPERLKDWQGKLDVESPALVGHSFGGATVLEAARTEDESLPWLAIFSLDPWMDPILEGNRSPNRIPLYCLNSEAFTVWQENFDKLKRVLHAAREANVEHRGWLMTLAGSSHLDFSDYPFLLPHLFRSTIGPTSTVGVFTRAVLVEFGLLRQRHRERTGKPGFKVEATRAEGKYPKLGEATSPEQKKSQLNEQGNGLDTSLQQADAVLPEVLRGITSASCHYDEEAPQDAKTVHDATHLIDKLLPHNLHLHSNPESSTPHGVIAKRTESGADLIGVPQSPAEAADLSEVVADIMDADRDAATVHASLEDISASLAHKRPKVHSLMGLLLRMYGIAPGIAQPGSIVVHSVP